MILNSKTLITTILMVYFCTFYISITECKRVRVRTGTSKIIKEESPQVLHRRRLKVVRPAKAPLPFPGPIKRAEEIESMKEMEKPKMEPEAEKKPIKEQKPEPTKDILESTFSTGFKRLFEYLGQFFFEGAGPQTEVKPPAFFPTNTTIFYKYDFNSLLRLFQATDPSQIEQLAETALIDTAIQLFRIVGIQDVREIMGMVVAYFLLGPIMVPYFWLPTSTLIMCGLLTPLFFYNPPSKLNENEMGHDPIKPEVKENHIVKRSLDLSKNVTQLIDDRPSLVESCLERVTCQVARFYRFNPVSQWLIDRFNATKVEWARFLNSHQDSSKEVQIGEDCSKYSCPVFPPAVGKFLSYWAY